MKLIAALHFCISSSATAILSSEQARLLEESIKSSSTLQKGFRKSFQSKIPLASQECDPPTKVAVVVLRVSLHCPGCARKVGKHISKMKGVTDFSINLEQKRVTVVGYVSPSGVLQSVGRVKNAEFWPFHSSRTI